ncbi:MAG TPA: hypothetical protein VGM90_02610 [Kofleriaceae bacterium]|jgi:hypothetical protein
MTGAFICGGVGAVVTVLILVRTTRDLSRLALGITMIVTVAILLILLRRNDARRATLEEQREAACRLLAVKIDGFRQELESHPPDPDRPFGTREDATWDGFLRSSTPFLTLCLDDRADECNSTYVPSIAAPLFKERLVELVHALQTGQHCKQFQ